MQQEGALEKFFDMCEEYRVMFGLKVHTHSQKGKNLIEVFSNGSRVVYATDSEDMDNCYAKACEELEFFIKREVEKVERFLGQRRQSES